MTVMILALLLFSIAPLSQAREQAHWIYFAPRPEADAARAISPLAAERMERLGIAPTGADLPVWEPYVAALQDLLIYQLERLSKVALAARKAGIRTDGADDNSHQAPCN